LQRQAGRHDLAEHRPDRLARKRAVRGRGQALQDRALALRNVEGLATLALAPADLLDDLGPAIEQRQDLIVDAVDRRAQLREIVWFGTAGHRQTIIEIPRWTSAHTRVFGSRWSAGCSRVSAPVSTR